MSLILSSIFLISGLVFIIVGAFGIYRFNNVFTRIHALSLIDNIGVNLMLIGLIFLQESWVSMIKVILLIVLILLLSPLACHAIANAAYHENKSKDDGNDGIFN